MMSRPDHLRHINITTIYFLACLLLMGSVSTVHAQPEDQPLAQSDEVLRHPRESAHSLLAVTPEGQGYIMVFESTEQAVKIYDTINRKYLPTDIILPAFHPDFATFHYHLAFVPARGELYFIDKQSKHVWRYDTEAQTTFDPVRVPGLGDFRHTISPRGTFIQAGKHVINLLTGESGRLRGGANAHVVSEFNADEDRLRVITITKKGVLNDFYLVSPSGSLKKTKQEETQWVDAPRDRITRRHEINIKWVLSIHDSHIHLVDRVGRSSLPLLMDEQIAGFLVNPLLTDLYYKVVMPEEVIYKHLPNLNMTVNSIAAGVVGECVSGNCQDGAGKQVVTKDYYYIGQFKNGLKHGQGEMVVGPNRMKGEFRRDNPHGVMDYLHLVTGKRERPVFVEGDRIGECLEGDCAEGQGVLSLLDGSGIEGSFEACRPVGGLPLVFTDKSGAVYSGQFNDGGKLHGLAEVSENGGVSQKLYLNGDYVSTCVSSSCTDGEATYEGPNGYTGQVDGIGLPHGKGIWTAPGKRLMGEFSHGYPVHGALWVDGRLLFTGHLNRDFSLKYGTYYLDNGDRYTGPFDEDGKPHGRGTVRVEKTKAIHEVEMKHGKAVKQLGK